MRYHDYDSLGTVRFIDIHTCFTFFFAELAVSKNITVYNIAQTPKTNSAIADTDVFSVG